MIGFSFNNRNSYNDFGLILEEHSIQPPKKVKILDSIPGMNGSYDFSTVASNGEQVYDTREIDIKVFLMQSDKTRLHFLYTRVLEWLMGTGQSKLIFDFLPGYYFMAEVQEAPSWDELIETGELSIKFVAEPLKYGTELAGDLLWDNIDFDLPDYIQDTSFTVNGAKTITLYNPGSHGIIPTIVANGDITCTLNGYTTTFPQGTSTDYGFKLENGTNIINISGNGNIQFNFRKEVL